MTYKVLKQQNINIKGTPKYFSVDTIIKAEDLDKQLADYYIGIGVLESDEAGKESAETKSKSKSKSNNNK